MEREHLVILDSSAHFQLLPSERRILLAAEYAKLAAEYAKCKNRHCDFTGPVRPARPKFESGELIPQRNNLR
jgi:hypothetical protein